MGIFVDRFKKAVCEIDREFDLEKGEFTVPIEKIQQPAGPLFALYKRTICGTNKPLLIGLTKAEAQYYYKLYNDRAQQKRKDDITHANEKGFEHIPEKVIFYDVVEQESDQESLFWNDKEILKGEPA